MWLEKWQQHVQRMDTNRIPKQALQYKPQESNLILPEHDDDDDDDDNDDDDEET